MNRERNCIQYNPYIKYPSQSPDINPIKNLYMYNYKQIVSIQCLYLIVFANKLNQKFNIYF